MCYTKQVSKYRNALSMPTAEKKQKNIFAVSLYFYSFKFDQNNASFFKYTHCLTKEQNHLGHTNYLPLIHLNEFNSKGFMPI